MSADEATPQEEQFAAMLAAFDDALAAGRPPPGNDAPAAIQPRLEQDLECLQLLHHLRPSSASLDLDDEAAAQRSDGTDFGGAKQSPSFAGSRVDQEGPGERYTLTRLHARGGIGQVWLAHDADLDRDVALKELQEERARNPAFAARFLHEARITSKLQHPGIVPVYELVPGMPSANGRRYGRSAVLHHAICPRPYPHRCGPGLPREAIRPTTRPGRTAQCLYQRL